MSTFGVFSRIQRLEEELTELLKDRKSLTDALNKPEAKKPRTPEFYEAHGNLRLWQTKVEAIKKELKELRDDNSH